MMSDQKKIGVGLLAFGLGFMVLGSLLLDRKLLAMGYVRGRLALRAPSLTPGLFLFATVQPHGCA